MSVEEFSSMSQESTEKIWLFDLEFNPKLQVVRQQYITQPFRRQRDELDHGKMMAEPGPLIQCTNTQTKHFLAIKNVKCFISFEMFSVAIGIHHQLIKQYENIVNFLNNMKT